MPIPATVLGLPLWAAIAVGASAAALARDAWLAREARDVVRRWTARHGYRLVRCRRAWSPFALLDVAPRQDASGAEVRRYVYEFDVAVEDPALGRTARGRVALRGDALAGFDPTVDVTWR